MIAVASQNTLLNRRAIRKLSENVALDRAAKKAKDKWLDMLERGKLKKEELNYTNFQKIILEGVLGYSLTDDVKFQQNDIEFQIAGPDGKTAVCIEAKGQGTDLWKPTPQNKNGAVGQLWWYMSEIIPKYGIVTDYDKFILFKYDVGRCQHYEFEFSSIRDSEYRLKEFVWIFSKAHMIGENSLEATRATADEIEKDLEEEFYDIFHRTRLMLVKEFEGCVDRSTAVDQAQSFLNRLIFVMFAESNDYVGRRLLYDQIKKSIGNKKIDGSTSVVFNAMDKVFRWFAEGHKNPDVFAFNGGLFTKSWPVKAQFLDMRPKEYFPNTAEKELKYAKDQIDVLEKNLSPIITGVLSMLRYDFESDLTVNILGHIFEQSLDDLDRLMDADASERKKMGVYYTPPYVTDYVCRQTIIPYLARKPDTTSTRDLIEQYDGELGALEERLRSIRILDPACGSGAFLVKAVDVLLDVHNEILEQKKDAGAYEVELGGKKGAASKNETFGMAFEQSVARKIIEECIFGIDINEQSVEISRIAMFFKIAGSRRKLPDLSKNIRRGNTILTRSAGGERPFDWAGERGFPQVCANKDHVVGVMPGFDVVIGNPPYVRQERLSDKDCMQLPRNNTLKGAGLVDKKADKSSYFYYHSLNWLKAGGRLGFIVSDSWMSFSYGKSLKRMLADNCDINVMLKPDYNVFKNIDVKTVITILTKGRSRNNVVRYAAVNEGGLFSNLAYKKKGQNEFGDEKWAVHFMDAVPEPAVKMSALGKTGKLFSGVSTKFNSYFVIGADTIEEYGIHEKFLHPVLLPKSTISGKVRNSDAGKYILAVTSPMADLLRDKDAKGLIRYIREGETRKFPDGSGKIPAESPTLRKKRFWFYMNTRGTPDAFLSAISNDRHKVVENGDGVGTTRFGALDTWVCFEARDSTHLHPLLAYIRSSMFSLHMEVVGHPMGGGALKMQVEDYAMMQVPDMAVLDAAGRNQMAKAWKSYCKTLDQDRLDGAVFDVLGLGSRKDEVVERLSDTIAKRKKR